MTIELDHHAVAAAIADLRAGAEHCHDAQHQAATEVDALLDGGWTGVAADSFAAGWADWQTAADDVLDGLVTIARLLDQVHADLSERDTDARTSLVQVARELTARLG